MAHTVCCVRSPLGVGEWASSLLQLGNLVVHEVGVGADKLHALLHEAACCLPGLTCLCLFYGVFEKLVSHTHCNARW